MTKRASNASPVPKPDLEGSRTSRAERTRAKILDAAEEVFGRLGYHATSVGEITKRAGVGMGTFYLYFPSKIEIYRHLLRSRQNDFIRAAREPTPGLEDQRDVAARAFKAFFDWITSRPAIMRMLREAEFVDSSLLEDLYRTPAEAYRQGLARAMELGRIAPTDPEVLAWCLMGMTEFTVLRFVVWNGGVPIEEEKFRAFVDIAVRMLGAPPRG